MKMNEIKKGDVFLGTVGMIQGSKKDGGRRPFRVIEKYKHFVLCETVPMINSYGVKTRPFKTGFLPSEINNILSKEEVRKWANTSVVGIVFPE